MAETPRARLRTRRVRAMRWLSRWAWTVPNSGCTCPFPRYEDDCPRHRIRRASEDAMIHPLASSAFVDGARVEVESIDGWLHIRTQADDEIIGYAVTVNGHELPYEPGREGVA